MKTDSNFEAYTGTLAAIADFIIDRLHLAVLFIPHVIGPNQLGGDDRFADLAVRKKMRHSERAYSIRGEYNAMELKGIIGRSQAFLGSRMHATIAATSMLVPTIGLAYSVKAHGVLGDLVKTRPIVYNIKELKPDDLFSPAEDLLKNRKQISAEIEANLPGVKERALASSRLSAALVASSNKS